MSLISDRLDGIQAGVAIKAPCRVSTTANITLSGEQTIDGVAVSANGSGTAPDRVLVKNQTNTVENGIYDVSTSGWTRAKDFDGARDVVQGTLVPVYAGTANGRTTWQCTTANPVRPGTSNITFEVVVDVDLAADLLDTSSAALGDALIGVKRVLTGAIATTLHAWIEGQPVNLKADYEAAGDGATNDYDEFVAALAVCAGKKLYAPAGTYKLPFTTTNACVPPANCVIEGEGKGITILQFEPDTTTYRNLFSFANSGLTLRNLTVRVVVPAGGQLAVFGMAANNLRNENVEFDGAMTNTGASLSHNTYLWNYPETGTQNGLVVQHCDVHGFKLPILKTNTATSSQARLEFSHCDFYENYSGDLSPNSPLGAMDDIQIYLCKFRDGKGADASLNQIYVAFASVTNFKVSLCNFAGDAYGAIHLEENCLGGVVSGNTINVDGHGIEVQDNNISGTSYMPRDIVISGNTIRKAGTLKEAGKYGLVLVNDASAEVPAKNLRISGNSVYGYERGYSLASTLDDACAVTDNNADNCTNGFQLAVGSFSVSGNTSKDCAVGVYGESGGACDAHTFINCTVNADANSRPLILTDPVVLFPEFNVGAGSTTVKNLFAMGASDRIHGYITSYVWVDAATSDYAARRSEVTWDGTTYTRTNKVTISPGGVTLDEVDNTGVLAESFFSTSARNNARLQVKLSGAVIVAV